MGDAVDGLIVLRTRLLANPFETSPDVMTRVVGRPVIFSNHELTDAVDGNVDSVSCASEVIDSVDFYGWESKDLLIDRCARD